VESGRSSTVAGPARWTNWGGNQVAAPQQLVRPRDEAELIAAVRAALAGGQEVRVVGSGHSFTPLVPTAGVLIDPREVTGVTAIDAAARRVRIRAATPIAALGEPLWERGLSLINQGDIDAQTIAGAIATATHGSGGRFGTLAAAVRWVRLIDGNGEVVEIGEDDPRRLHAVQVSLGALGVLLEVELEVAPAYYLQERISCPRWEETIADWERDIEENRHYSFLWCPADDSTAGFDLAPPMPMKDRSYTKRYREVEVDEAAGEVSREKGARRDRAYRVYVSGGTIPPFHELEYFVPRERGLEAVAAVRELMRTRHPEQRYPIEVRWVRGEEAYLSPAYRRDSTVVSVCGAPGTDYGPFFRDVDAELAPYAARPHWGKLHFLDRERVAALYPQLDSFLAVRSELDPRGLFLNDHLRGLFG
jgi:FAD/FMN-containing dehydrogenase